MVSYPCHFDSDVLQTCRSLEWPPAPVLHAMFCMHVLPPVTPSFGFGSISWSGEHRHVVKVSSNEGMAAYAAAVPFALPTSL
jgi:hypothetical protein